MITIADTNWPLIIRHSWTDLIYYHYLHFTDEETEADSQHEVTMIL